ncbi:uncharacterized protein PGTG_05352 [Puccinia graminis f. sp. tritici CRL 75-36-700-3]|uniref:Very-long-chain 3-oxoacyl-CoA reductase n=1 Tax=Puccinia graminis f. sp. tritici (strain CRL 75-36-700-3 / race SCCL) TaxID=418459 RepID=E3K774_PUCGT|nr:uncharacterized protein PGTG_05352 [Puccinia graminis f. sp. tritici CRL 75-36-700-3]EFP80127.2 hypothetical protein PGTG_05352 [Puccinia graminis f. sp. tritici CRL 75-36-700-3]
MSFHGLVNLVKSVQAELMNVKATPGSILIGSLSLIGLLTVAKYQLSFMNLLFCFSPLSKPFKISLGSLKGNLFLKQKDRQGGEKDQKTPATKNSSSWAIITGPTNGIGKEFAIELSKAGFNLFLIGRNPNKLTSLQDELMKVNPTIEVEIETIDLSDNNPGGRGEEKDSGSVAVQEQTQSKEWKKILEKLKQISSRSNISILINNAGLSHSEPIEFQMNDLDQDINSLLNVNVFSVLYLTKLVLPFMLPYKKGLILNVGSFSALIPTPLLSTYAGSKGFLYTWSQALGTELEPRGIDVKLLNTYFVASEMSKIKKASFLIPTPNAYVKQVLNNLISTNSKPFITTGYFSHSLLEFFLDHFGSLKFWLKFNLNMQRSIVKRIQKKKQRIQQQQSKN